MVLQREDSVVSSTLPSIGQDGLSRLAVDRIHRFTPLAQALHWLTAGLMIAIVVIAWHMKMYPKTDDGREFWYYLHESIGVTILALTAARLVWRRISPPPSSDARSGKLGRVLAAASHWGLYGVLIAMPVSGYLVAAGSGHSLPYFFMFTIPPLVPKTQTLFEIGRLVHAVCQWIVYGLFSLHLLATVWHVAVLRDGTLERMLPPQSDVI